MFFWLCSPDYALRFSCSQRLLNYLTLKVLDEVFYVVFCSIVCLSLVFLWILCCLSFSWTLYCLSLSWTLCCLSFSWTLYCLSFSWTLYCLSFSWTLYCLSFSSYGLWLLLWYRQALLIAERGSKHFHFIQEYIAFWFDDFTVRHIKTIRMC